jgi:hypothetical protein
MAYYYSRLSTQHAAEKCCFFFFKDSQYTAGICFVHIERKYINIEKHVVVT